MKFFNDVLSKVTDASAKVGETAKTKIKDRTSWLRRGETR